MILSYVMEKGGSSKTTNAINTAIKCSLEGLDVLFVDADPSQMATLYFALRAENPEAQKTNLTCISKVGDIKKDVLAMSQKFDVTIIDTGGRDSLEARSAMLISQAIVIPVVPSQFDIWTLDKMLRLYGDVKGFNENLKCFILRSRVSTNPMIKEGEELTRFLKEECELGDAQVLDSIIYDRIAYRKVLKTGLSIFEGEPDKARQDFENYFNELNERLA